ncbi:hypothetical protein DFH06DRAFT_1477072 [Mycena polygramma]|nr:hypothetical protein DFH06DRAFT_1477072 [Mycena polygramma]
MLYFLGLALTVVLLTGCGLARPVPAIYETQTSWRLDLGNTQCFTERAADASDCQTLFANPPTANWTNQASPGAQPIFNPFCSGSCCIFTTMADIPTDELVMAGTTLIGCLQPANGLVNGVTETPSGGVCMADPTGANSCLCVSR